jgi:iron(III) transport system substrate-binding protein
MKGVAIMSIRKRLFLILTTILMIQLVACDGDRTETPATSDVAPATGESPGAGTENGSAESSSVEVESGSPGRLVIYSGRSESLVQPIIDQFESATGIDVQVRYGSTAEMAGVLLEEGTSSPADVFYAQDPGGLGAVQAAGLLQALPEGILDQVPERFRSDDASWVGISGRARVIAYNTEAIPDPAAEIPEDIFDFVDPKWNGRIGWAPTNGSFLAMVTGMRSVWGDEKTREWLQGIQANNPVVFEGNTPIVDAVASGEIDAGFVNHYYLYRFLSEQGEGFGARNYFLPGGGPGSLIMVSGAGILEDAENVNNARRFIEFLLSTPGQQYFASQTFEYPVNEEGVQLPGSLPALAELDALATDISLTSLADVKGTQDMLIDLGIID